MMPKLVFTIHMYIYSCVKHINVYSVMAFCFLLGFFLLILDYNYYSPILLKQNRKGGVSDSDDKMMMMMMKVMSPIRIISLISIQSNAHEKQ